MANLSIHVFRIGETNPETKISIPVNAFRIASNLLPKKAAATLENEGIDLGKILELSQAEEVVGTLIEIEELKKNMKVVIAIE